MMTVVSGNVVLSVSDGQESLVMIVINIIINRNHISDGVAGGKRCIAQGGDEVAGRTELVDSGGLAGE